MDRSAPVPRHSPRPRRAVALARLVMLPLLALGALAIPRAAGAQDARPTPAPSAPATSVTLDEAVQRALAVSPEVVRGTGNVRAARAGQRSATGAFLPSLSFESNAIRATTPSPVAQPGASGGVADRTAAVGVVSSLDIFTANRRGSERARASALTASSEATLVAQRYQAVLRAKQAYFEVLRAGELARVSAERVKRAEEGLSAATLRHDVGTATGSDVFRARLELSNAKQEVLQVEAARRAARFALGRVVGAEGALDAAVTDTLRPAPLAISDDSLLLEIERAAPAVRAATSSARAAGAAVGSARSRYAPVVQLTGGFRYITDFEPAAAPLVDDRPLWNVRLGMSYPLFDGFQRDEAVARATAERDAAEASRADSRRAARAEGERLLAALHVAEERITLAEEGVTVATEDLRVITARYRAGAAAILDRITSQVNLAQAETNLVTLRYDYQLARAQLEALAGRDL